MREPSSRVCLHLLLAITCCLSSFAAGQQYLYTNDNVSNHINSTTALKVSTAGAVKMIKTYSTGGRSAGGGAYYASRPIAYVKTSSSSCLFLSNGGDSTISAFKINLKNGQLSAVKGSPFAYGVTGSQPNGISLASGNGKLLFAGNSGHNSVSVLKIAASCSLKSASSTTVSYSPVDLKTTPNGKYLIASYMGPVDSFTIDYGKSQLKELGPFSSSGSAAGIDITCDGATAFFGDAAANTEVEAYRIQSNGKLSELANYKDKKGSNSNNVMLSKDQKTLYVTNNQSSEISILQVGRNGVEFRQGIIKLNKPGQFADALAENKAGTQLFVSEARDPESAGVLLPKRGSLKEVPGSPFGVVSNFFAPAGLIAVPGFACK